VDRCPIIGVVISQNTILPLEGFCGENCKLGFCRSIKDDLQTKK
jgi:hypothetical protein